jgi:hypothetical protein
MTVIPVRLSGRSMALQAGEKRSKLEKALKVGTMMQEEG